jgi:RNA polymerase sigma-70 factor (ECF subfamily)
MARGLSAPAPPSVSTTDDLALAGRVAARDGSAFELIMRRHNRRLFRVARSILGNNADAEDALQDAYLSAYHSIAAFRGDCSLATWLSRVVANESLGRLRRQARRDHIVPIQSAAPDNEEEQLAMPDTCTESPEAALGRAELRALLERRLDELPVAFRTVFVLRCVEELSVEETARCLDLPQATVRTRHFRARAMLRESLSQELDLAQRDVFSFDGARCDRIVSQVLARLGPAAL